ncbi:MAG: F0F1 ATP synthase subunit delta [Candidatus Nanopelagicales bacterium]
MSGSSRANYSGLRARLDQRRDDPALPGLSGELFAAADVIGADPHLPSALSDSGQPVAARQAMVAALFGSRLSATAVEVLADVVGQRWSAPVEIMESLEGIAAQAGFLVSDRDGTLDAVENDLFAFAQTVSGSADLQMALTNPALTSGQKSDLVRELLEGRALPQSVEVLAYAMGHLRGRRTDSVLEDLSEVAAEQRDRSVAQVRVARPLDEDQAARLGAALSRLQGRDIRLNVAIDPEMIGGISVRIGNELIDATVAHRIEQARRALVG